MHTNTKQPLTRSRWIHLSNIHIYMFSPRFSFSHPRTLKYNKESYRNKNFHPPSCSNSTDHLIRSTIFALHITLCSLPATQLSCGHAHDKYIFNSTCSFFPYPFRPLPCLWICIVVCNIYWFEEIGTKYKQIKTTKSKSTASLDPSVNVWFSVYKMWFSGRTSIDTHLKLSGVCSFSLLILYCYNNLFLL